LWERDEKVDSILFSQKYNTNFERDPMLDQLFADAQNKKTTQQEQLREV
jgi:hemoglobin-like flavoprotein